LDPSPLIQPSEFVKWKLLWKTFKKNYGSWIKAGKITWLESEIFRSSQKQPFDHENLEILDRKILQMSLNFAICVVIAAILQTYHLFLESLFRNETFFSKVFYGVKSDAGVEEHPSITEAKVREVIKHLLQISRDVPILKVRWVISASSSY
jgi:hypothetical protein